MDTPAYITDAKGGLEYTSPSGRVFTPLYQIVPYEVSRKNKEFEFIDVEGTYVQDMGMSSGVFALKLYFVGNEHHKFSEAFLSALSESGTAKISFPLDSTDRSVIPTSIKKEVDFVDATNRTIFEVRFKETIKKFVNVPTKPGYPEQEPSKEGETSTAFVGPPEKLTLAEKAQNAINTTKGFLAAKLKGVGDKASSIKLVKTLNSGIKKTLAFGGELQVAGGVVISASREALDAFDSATAAIDSAANSLFEQPLILASRIQSAMSIPRFPLVINLIDNYKSFLGFVQRAPRSYTKGTSDYLQVQTVFGVSALNALGSKVLDADFNNRQEAVEALADVKGAYEDFVEYIEAQEAATASLALDRRFEVDSDVYEALYEMMQGVSGGIDEILVGLPQTVSYTLAYPATPINLVAKHYPTLFISDPHVALDLFEQTNDLNGDEMFLLDRGREYEVLI